MGEVCGGCVVVVVVFFFFVFFFRNAVIFLGITGRVPLLGWCCPLRRARDSGAFSVLACFEFVMCGSSNNYFFSFLCHFLLVVTLSVVSRHWRRNSGLCRVADEFIGRVAAENNIVQLGDFVNSHVYRFDVLLMSRFVWRFPLFLYLGSFW